MTESALTPPRLCKNCGNILQGSFCSFCGQPDKNVRRPLFSLLKELIHVIFELDGRAYRTLFFLFTRPGYLSKEYVEDRRVSYTPPLRLFLALSIFLFFSLSLNSFIDGLDTSVANQDSGTATLEFDASTDPASAASQLVDDATNRDGAGIVLDGDEEEIASDIEDLKEVFSEVVLPLISAEANSRLLNFIISQTETNYRRIREDPSEFIYGSLEYITVFLLLMMPLMAAIQKILYLGSKRYYVEHFVLALHNHTFLIMATLISLPLQAAEASTNAQINWPASLLSTAVNIWIVVYLFLSMRRFYGGGFGLTALKFLTATIVYSVLLAIGLGIFMAINFILF